MAEALIHTPADILVSISMAKSATTFPLTKNTANYFRGRSFHKVWITKKAKAVMDQPANKNDSVRLMEAVKASLATSGGQIGYL